MKGHMKRIYIAGCGGMLGEAFNKEFSVDHELRCTDIDLNESWLQRCDMRDFDEYRRQVREFRPDYLFHLGALTDLEYCELHPDEAYMTNALTVEHAVHISREQNIPLLYISTAGIFDGAKDTYDDWDSPNPLGHYARSKYAGEVFVKENATRFLVCRAGWMMGGGPGKDKKFVQKIMRQLRDGQKELFVVNDKLGTPTYTHDFARNVKALFQKEMWGVYNMVCEGVTSRLDVCRELIKLLGLERNVSIKEVSSEHFQKEYFAVRPASERLINSKLNLRGLNVMRHWTVGLKEYLLGYYKDYLPQ